MKQIQQIHRGLELVHQAVLDKLGIEDQPEGGTNAVYYGELWVSDSTDNVVMDDGRVVHVHWDKIVEAIPDDAFEDVCQLTEESDEQ